MRFLLKATIPVEAGNEMMMDGSLKGKMKSVMDELKPEAAYFTEEGGKRTAIFIVNISEPSQMPSVAEPLFLNFKADVEFHPVMVPEDLMKAAPAIERIVAKIK